MKDTCLLKETCLIIKSISESVSPWFYFRKKPVT